MELDKEENLIEEEKPSIIKKMIIIFIGLFLLLLIVTYFIISPNVLSLLTGFLQSSKLNNSMIIIDNNTKLMFNNSSLETLNELYAKNLNHEFKVCLKGKKIDNTYFIEETIQPKTYLQQYNKVIADACTDEHIVDLHTHPFRQCLPSEIDLRNFKEFKKKNKDALLAIMCEKNRFNFYK